MEDTKYGTKIKSIFLGQAKIINSINSNYPEVELELIELKYELNIGLLIVPKNERCKGIATEIVNIIFDYAKSINKAVTCIPSLQYGATSVERLVEFYKRLGFIENNIIRDKRFKIKKFVKLV